MIGCGQYWERAEFPHHLIPGFGALKVAGTTIEGYGCPGMAVLGSAMVVCEVQRILTFQRMR